MGLYNRFCKRFYAAVIIRLTAQSDSRAQVPFVSAGTEYIYKPCFFKENQKGDAYSVYPGVFTPWMFGLWFSLTAHGLQIGAPPYLQHRVLGVLRFFFKHFYPTGGKRLNR